MGRKARLKKLKKAEEQEQPLPQPFEIKIGPVYQKIIFSLCLLILFAIGVILRIENSTNVPRRSPDEGIYTSQAKVLAEQGPAGQKLLIDKYNSNKVLWVYPPPTRIGYLWLLASVMKLTHTFDENAGTYVSCAFSVISLFLLVLIGMRFFNPWITLYALLFMSVSPMDLAIARRTWQDAMIGGVGLFLIYCCCEITRAANKIVWYILFIVVGGYSTLIKESGIIIYGLCAAWLLWLLVVKEKSISKGAIFLFFCALGMGMSIALLSYAVGGIQVVIQIWNHIKEAVPTNTYALEYQSGPWHRFLWGFWVISPINAVLCLLGIAAACVCAGPYKKIGILSLERNREVVVGMIFFILGLIAATVVPPHLQNLRYVSALYAPFYLISGWACWGIMTFVKSKLNNLTFFVIMIGVVLAIIVLAAKDYRNFERIFIERGIVDISTGLLREISQLKT